MANFELMRRLQEPNDTTIVLLIMDGLGGLAVEPAGPTELEAAHTPNMDRMAHEGTLGQIIPVARGITPGSGPAHLALFGYDPLKHNVGRGVIEASGIGMTIQRGDVAARGNFCTVDDDGRIVDRRAGRISSDESKPLVERLDGIQLGEVSAEVQLLREYRIALVLRGPDLHPAVEETDPLEVGEPPLEATATKPEAERTAELVNRWVAEARSRLADEPKANAITLRGFSTDPALPTFPEIYGLKSACIAVYPMYRGVSRLVGMHVESFEGEEPANEFQAAEGIWDDYDFLFIHIKKPDSLGEDGAFDKKSAYIERVDEALMQVLDLEPDVVAITGDHSTPARMRYHSWHPVPLLLWAPETVRQDAQAAFGETQCGQGGLGTFPSSELMPLLMAHARRLQKFGA